MKNAVKKQNGKKNPFANRLLEPHFDHSLLKMQLKFLYGEDGRGGESKAKVITLLSKDFQSERNTWEIGQHIYEQAYDLLVSTQDAKHLEPFQKFNGWTNLLKYARKIYYQVNLDYFKIYANRIIRLHEGNIEMPVQLFEFHSNYPRDNHGQPVLPDSENRKYYVDGVGSLSEADYKLHIRKEYNRLLQKGEIQEVRHA